MLTIKPLDTLDLTRWQQIVTGYTSHEKYAIDYNASDEDISFRLSLVPLAQPYHKQFDYLQEMADEYELAVAAGFSLGVFAGDTLVAIAVTVPQQWNQSLWLQEFHVAQSHRGAGIGRQLMKAVIEMGKREGYRIINLETQNTNVPAIRFYHKMGFRIESVDLSLYSNDDYPDGEIALMMKYRLPPPPDQHS